MSTFVLNRNYALQMPSSYVDIDRDEMEYVDGGLSISRNVFRYTVTATVIAACAFLGGGFAVSG